MKKIKPGAIKQRHRQSGQRRVDPCRNASEAKGATSEVIRQRDKRVERVLRRYVQDPPVEAGRRAGEHHHTAIEQRGLHEPEIDGEHQRVSFCDADEHMEGTG